MSLGGESSVHNATIMSIWATRRSHPCGQASVRRGGKQNPAGRIRAHTPGAGATAAGLGSLLGATLCVGGPCCPSTESDVPSASRLGSLLGTKAHWLQRGSHSGATNAVPDPFVCCAALALVCNGGANVAMDRQPLSRRRGNMHDGMPQSIAPKVIAQPASGDHHV